MDCPASGGVGGCNLFIYLFCLFVVVFKKGGQPVIVKMSELEEQSGDEEKMLKCTQMQFLPLLKGKWSPWILF